MAKRSVTGFSLQDLGDYLGAVCILPGLLVAEVRAKAKGWRVDTEWSFSDPKKIEERFVRGTKTYYRYAGKTWIIKDSNTR
ncbi:MAG: hypothetical protein Q7T36_13120 [Fluviicoccus sp.]|uniref:hypothetical protein n=1 Tax=Fluviicoccus sp. TaxID=2003552 RepID=UPI002717A11B|nr:hypothetical protein [Fluviicoccus sp.]MDO8331399.1 hypothetical protein [Fluviicoccus sp.]